MTFEISGIREVRIDGELYTRIVAEQTTSGGRTIVNKYFRREKDGHLIHEHKFMKKLKRLQREKQTQDLPYYYCVNNFGDTKRESYGYDYVNKWRFWFSGETLNIEPIIF